MAEDHDTIEQAVALAVKGAAHDGMQLLWPLVRDDATRDPALFALAFCYERAENFATATYLYGWIVEQHPDFNVAAKRLEKCREEAHARGITEDFEDAGHVSCPCGLFRQRAEYGACPYCGRPRDESGPPPEGQDGTQSEELSAPGKRFRELKEDAAARLKELSEAESIKRLAARAEELARVASRRMKALAESDAAKDVLEKTKELGRKTSSRARRIIDRPEVQDSKKKLHDWGEEKTSEIAGWAKSERVQTAAKKVLETFEGVLARIQALIDRMKK